MAQDSLKVTGTISHIFDERQVSEKFKLQEFGLQIGTDTQYPQTIKFQVTNDKIDLLAPYAVGQEVEVSFNLRGRLVEGTAQRQEAIYNSLDVWRIQAVGVQAAPAQSANKNPALQRQQAQVEDTSGDLPF